MRKKKKKAARFSTEAWVAACFVFGAAAGYGGLSMLAVGGEEIGPSLPRLSATFFEAFQFFVIGGFILTLTKGGPFLLKINPGHGY